METVDPLKKIPRRTAVPKDIVYDEAHFQRMVGMREDGTTNHTAGILAATRSEKVVEKVVKPVDQSASVVLGVKALISSDAPPKSRSSARKEKEQNAGVSSGRNIRLRIVGDADFKNLYEKMLLNFGMSLYKKTGKLAPIGHAKFIHALLRVVSTLPSHDQLLVEAFEEQKQ